MKKVVHRSTDGKLIFMCPGCECGHWVQVAPLGPPTWTWNGDDMRPTFSPSIKTWWGPDGKNICHSFVTDGMIQFLTDCTHAMAGKTVPLEAF